MVTFVNMYFSFITKIVERLVDTTIDYSAPNAELWGSFLSFTCVS